MNIRIKRLHDSAVVPQYAHHGDAGFDLVAVHDEIIGPGEKVKVHTGLAFEIPAGYELQIRPRSGISLRTPLRIPNSPATIDSSYRGEVIVLMENIKQSTHHISAGDRIAQGVIAPVVRATFDVVDDLDDTERGAGGFGSTGITHKEEDKI